MLWQVSYQNHKIKQKSEALKCVNPSMDKKVAKILIKVLSVRTIHYFSSVKESPYGWTGHQRYN